MNSLTRILKRTLATPNRWVHLLPPFSPQKPAAASGRLRSPGGLAAPQHGSVAATILPCWGHTCSSCTASSVCTRMRDGGGHRKRLHAQHPGSFAPVPTPARGVSQHRPCGTVRAPARAMTADLMIISDGDRVTPQECSPLQGHSAAHAACRQPGGRGLVLNWGLHWQLCRAGAGHETLPLPRGVDVGVLLPGRARCALQR